MESVGMCIRYVEFCHHFRQTVADNHDDDDHDNVY